jgi:hypothetical protein
MRTIRHVFIFLVAFGVTTVVVGCGDNYGGRVEVTGKVTLVGEPIKEGMIVFKPASANNKDTQNGSKIENGTYTVPRKQGLLPGKYIVQVMAPSDTPANTPDPDAGPGPSGGKNYTGVDRVPDDWNIHSKHEVEVLPDKSSQEFNFEIDRYNPKYKPKK